VGFCAMTVGVLFRDFQIPLWLGLIISIAMGLGLGAGNGFLVSILKIPSIIVTLGTLNAYRGLAFIICNNQQVDSHQMPSDLGSLVQNGISFGSLLIPWLVWIALGVLVLFVFIMKYSKFGREIYAVGSNADAAFLRGINVKRTLFWVFAITGALAGLAAIMYASRYGYVNPSNTGAGFEFVVISATIIGGTSINGGSGSVLGTLLGCILLGSINTMLATLGVAGTFQQASYGLIIILALVIDTFFQKGQKRQMTKRVEKAA
ncbi:MAG: ABC transporter permease, partial [Eubacteriales bacterium]